MRLHGFGRAVVLAVATVGAAAVLGNAAHAQDPASLSDELHPVAGLLGEWVVTPHAQDSSGAWVIRPSTRSIYAPVLGGRFIEGRGALDLEVGLVESIETLSFDPFSRVYRMTWNDSLAGLMDVYEGEVVDGALVLDNLRSGTFWTAPDSISWAFRIEYDLEVVDGVRESRVHASDDGGKTWSLFQRTEYRRVP